MISTLQLGGALRSRVVRGTIQPPAYAALVANTASQSLVTATTTDVTHNSETRDDGGLWASSPNPERMIAPSDGWYIATHNHRSGMSAGSGRTWQQYLYKNTTVLDRQASYCNVNVDEWQSIGTASYLVSTDYIKTGARQNSGGNLSIPATTRFACAKVGPPTVLGCRVERVSSAQSFANASWVLNTFPTEVRDDGGLFNTGTPTRFTIPSGGDGWYWIAGHQNFDTGSSAGRRIYIRRNGSQFLARCSTITDNVQSTNVNAVAVAYLAATDYLELIGDQNDGGALNSSFASFALVRVANADYIGASVSRSTTQSLSAVNEAAVSFDTTHRNDGGVYNAGAPTRLTVPAYGDGWYAMSGSFQFSGQTSSSPRHAYILMNGASGIANMERQAFASMNDPHMNVCAIRYLTAGDYFELFGYDGSGTTSMQGTPYFAMVRLPQVT